MSLDGFAHLGIGEIDGWQRVAAGGPTSREDGDSDWQRKVSVLRTADAQLLGMVIPVDAEPLEPDPTGSTAVIGGREVHFGAAPIDITAGRVVEWTEGLVKVSLWTDMSAEPLAALVPELGLDADGYLTSVAGSEATVEYRGDIAPWFAVTTPLVGNEIPLDEVIGYRAIAATDGLPSLVVGVLRGRADGLELVRSLASFQGATITGLHSFGTVGLAGSFPPPGPDDGPMTGQFAVIPVDNDLVVITSAGLDAREFENLLATLTPIDDATWTAWNAETPLAAYFAEVEQAANQSADSARPADVTEP